MNGNVERAEVERRRPDQPLPSRDDRSRFHHGNAQRAGAGPRSARRLKIDCRKSHPASFRRLLLRQHLQQLGLADHLHAQRRALSSFDPASSPATT